jgi:carboxylesterase type B
MGRTTSHRSRRAGTGEIFRDEAAALAARLLKRKGIETEEDADKLHWEAVRKQQQAEDEAAWDREHGTGPGTDVQPPVKPRDPDLPLP